MEDPTMQAIADELLAMGERDQAMRKIGPRDDSVDIANTQRMKEIVAQIGWPTKSKVGNEASHIAWLLVQHTYRDKDFQRMCLELMKSQLAGEVRPVEIAYLEDRVNVFSGLPQHYGTQFHADEAGNYVPFPIADPEHVDERRAALGLKPLSEHTREIAERYGKK